MTDTAELMKRLREDAGSFSDFAMSAMNEDDANLKDRLRRDRREAADALEALQAENAKLKHANKIREETVSTLYWEVVDLQYDVQFAISQSARRIAEEREWAESEARRYACFYPEGSDGRNTFTIFADAIRARSNEAQVKHELER